MQPSGANCAFFGEALRKSTPLFYVAVGNTDDDWHAELHSIDKCITQSPAFGLELAEFVEDYEIRSAFERCREQGGGFRQRRPIQSATSCFLSTILRQFQDGFRG